MSRSVVTVVNQSFRLEWISWETDVGSPLARMHVVVPVLVLGRWCACIFILRYVRRLIRQQQGVYKSQLMYGTSKLAIVNDVEIGRASCRERVCWIV